MKNRCPLLDREIDEGLCFDIQMASEHLLPKDEKIEEIENVENFDQICLMCKRHDK